MEFKCDKCNTPTDCQMFYVYLDGFYGTEFIGKSETYEGAKEIKDKKDAQWRPGYLWKTRIATKEEKETSYFD